MPRVEDFDAVHVLPARAFSRLTVRAAFSSARFSDAPAAFAESLMCSYWRARFVPFLTPDGGMSSSSCRVVPARLPVRPSPTCGELPGMGAALDPRGLAAIFAGGFAGAIARVALAESWISDPAHWPWATFAANIAGALVLGYVAARLRDGPARQLVGTGFCGALTTFSTMQLELLRMLDGEHYALAAAYAVVSLALGLAAVAGPGRRVAAGAEPVVGG